jgi:predicted nucleotidyltransferase
MRTLPEVQKVVLFGSVAKPLQCEVARFGEYRRANIEVWHECNDVDIAVWISRLDRLRDLQTARSRALGELVEREVAAWPTTTLVYS